MDSVCGESGNRRFSLDSQWTCLLGETKLDNARPTILPSEIKPSDVVILVLGTTGSGMSNFINKLTGMPAESGTDALGSCTVNVRAYACNHHGRRFVFVDTPGFNSSMSQTEVLTRIAHWLRTTYRSAIRLTGAIYTYRITDAHASGAELTGLQLFTALCGDEMADRVRLVTTMWDEANEELAAGTESRITAGPWKALLDAGSGYERFFNTEESAWNIVRGLGDSKKALLLQRELVDIGLEFVQTTVGRQLHLGTTQVRPPFAPYPRVAIPISEIKPTDIVIMVLGITGSGTSNFINKLTGMPEEYQAFTLGSCTVDVKAYAYGHDGKRFIFVDTPGLNNLHASKIEVLRKVMDWLREAYHTSVRPTGVIYTRRITDGDESGADRRSFKTLVRLCGTGAADRVRLVTTMWDDADMVSDAHSMEDQLKSTHWKTLLDAGACYERFHNTRESAWEIVLGIGETKKPFLVQNFFDLRKQLAIKTSEIAPNDNVVLVLGTTGSGMSNFINKLTGMRPETRSQELISCTRNITPYIHYCGDRRYVFVDTPGLDSPHSSQRSVLKKIEDWLATIYRKSIKPTGVIYTHRISEAHESGTKWNNLRLISDLCGHEAADRVRVVTTMWDEADVAFAETVENTMKAGPWKSLLDAGARYARFDNTPQSAWEIVLGLGDTKKALFVQEDHAMRKQLERIPTLRRVPSNFKLVSSMRLSRAKNTAGHSRGRLPTPRSAPNAPFRGRGGASTPFGVPVSSSEIKPSDVVILVSGTTGSGISNFINKLTGIEEEPQCGELDSCTKDVRVYACDRDGQRFIFVDTPGFNATRLSQRAVLRKAAEWLESTYQMAIELTGVIYLRRITDTYSSGAEQQSFRIFSGMCGMQAADRVRLVTTMWDKVDDDRSALQVQSRLEAEWGSLLSAGALYRNFYNTSESAWEIVDELGYERKALLFQLELVNMKKKLEETTAGMRAPEYEVEPKDFLEDLFGRIRKLFKFLERAYLSRPEEWALDTRSWVPQKSGA